jgi:hypothetical protein
MPDSLDALELRRADLVEQIRHLGDFRPGSITTTSGRCGTTTCHCHQPHDPGHGPNFRLTFKPDGKTVTVSFPSEAARRKAERETREYRHWQQLSREFVNVNAAICRLRPLPEPEQTPQEKERRRRSNGKSRTR